MSAFHPKLASPCSPNTGRSHLAVYRRATQTKLPRGAFSILPAHRESSDLFTNDPRLKLLSFTSSPEVG